MFRNIIFTVLISTALLAGCSTAKPLPASQDTTPNNSTTGESTSQDAAPAAPTTLQDQGQDQAIQQFLSDEQLMYSIIESGKSKDCQKIKDLGLRENCLQTIKYNAEVN